MDVPIDVDSVVLASKDDGPVGGQGHVEALGMPHLAFERGQKLKRTKQIVFPKSGCGSVGRAVAFDTGGPRFDHSHQQNFIEHLFIINCTEKTKINKKRPGMAHFFIKKPNYFFPFLPFLYYFFLSYLFIFINHFSIFLYSFF